MEPSGSDSKMMLVGSPLRSRFFEDVSGETAIVPEPFLDMNGKRVKSKSLARTCTNIKVTCRVGALPERPQGVPGGVHYPRKFRRGAHTKRPQKIPGGVHYPCEFKRGADTHGEREAERG